MNLVLSTLTTVRYVSHGMSHATPIHHCTIHAAAPWSRGRRSSRFSSRPSCRLGSRSCATARRGRGSCRAGLVFQAVFHAVVLYYLAKERV